VLWADEKVFAKYSQSGGNAVMYLMTEYALKRAEGMEFETPVELLDMLLTEVYDYGKSITGNKDMRMTFALNALVSIDNAAWLLYCQENGIDTFDDMIPADVRHVLPCRQDMLAGIPLVTYGVPKGGIERIVNEGNFFLKIKIGSDPEKDGDRQKMLKWDKQRLAEIHEVVRDMRTSYTDNEYILYYLDANGRYDSRSRLEEFLEHADRIGALERIILLEEPFPEDFAGDVSDMPVRIAADESAHTEEDVLRRIDMGYGAIALKPIAKTLSMSFRMCKAAALRGVPCFCADLTVNPLLVDWNKNVAARLNPLPGMKMGVLESNGHQNYINWEKMKEYHPCKGSEWIDTHNGLYKLGENFYKESGGIFRNSSHYFDMVEK
jgi:hypothetical protein